MRLTQLALRLLQMLLANAGHAVSSDRLLLRTAAAGYRLVVD